MVAAVCEGKKGVLVWVIGGVELRENVWEWEWKFQWEVDAGDGGKVGFWWVGNMASMASWLEEVWKHVCVPGICMCDPLQTPFCPQSLHHTQELNEATKSICRGDRGNKQVAAGSGVTF